jgi:hypothetical protein
MKADGSKRFKENGFSIFRIIRLSGALPGTITPSASWPISVSSAVMPGGGWLLTPEGHKVLARVAR